MKTYNITNTTSSSYQGSHRYCDIQEIVLNLEILKALFRVAAASSNAALVKERQTQAGQVNPITNGRNVGWIIVNVTSHLGYTVCFVISFGFQCVNTKNLTETTIVNALDIVVHSGQMLNSYANTLLKRIGQLFAQFPVEVAEIGFQAQQIKPPETSFLPRIVKFARTLMNTFSASAGSFLSAFMVARTYQYRCD